ncbi:Hachiman antiphage defense system protein HamA [Afipia sp. DC4300-2b1]|uniref:Hachiman antiphage defense system protein HamA n=1 Tax=Afipia sp. DC4300-2b1 TaxID=2804672 RepID=UPI003CE9289E
MSVPAHLDWLVDTGERLKSADGIEIEVWELKYGDDAARLSAWAKHFREHYCDDDMLEKLVAGTGKTNAEYLLNDKFPDEKNAPGPSIRSGDFAEILVADYVEYKLGYWSPRQLRYDLKWNRNESTKGCDVLGFQFIHDGGVDPNDELFVFESKAAMSGSKPINRLQDAVADSGKDMLREATTLNALKQRFYERGEDAAALKVQRFQNMPDRPFKRISGAAAVLSSSLYDGGVISQTTTVGHFNAANLKLIVIRGETLMELVNALYARAANEA